MFDYCNPLNIYVIPSIIYPYASKTVAFNIGSHII